MAKEAGTYSSYLFFQTLVMWPNLSLFLKNFKGGPVNVDQIVKFCKKKFPKPTDQDRGMRAAFEALDKDGYQDIFLFIFDQCIFIS